MEEESNEQENSLSKYYHFENEDDKQAYLLQREGYFDRVVLLLPKVEAAKSKLENIQSSLRRKVIKLREQIKAQAEAQKKNASPKKMGPMKFSKGFMSAKNSDEDNLLIKDLIFCQEALIEGRQISAQMDSGKLTLENILATREKKTYKVITDIALNPLPSDRSKEQNNKGKNQAEKNSKKSKNGSENDKKNHLQSLKDKVKKKSGNHSKMSHSDWKKLRNGQSLDSPTDVQIKKNTNVSENNINLIKKMRQNGGLDYLN